MAKSSKAQEVWIANSDGIYCDTVILTPNQAKQQLPSRPVPPGRHVLVKSNPANPLASIILVDGRQVGDRSWPLVPNESVAYRVTDTGALYVGALTAVPPAGLVVNYTLEAD